jgi:hypothetical protein
MNSAQKEAALLTLTTELEKATDERLIERLNNAIAEVNTIEIVEDGSTPEA